MRLKPIKPVPGDRKRAYPIKGDPYVPVPPKKDIVGVPQDSIQNGPAPRPMPRPKPRPKPGDGNKRPLPMPKPGIPRPGPKKPKPKGGIMTPKERKFLEDQKQLPNRPAKPRTPEEKNFIYDEKRRNPRRPIGGRGSGKTKPVMPRRGGK